MGRTAYKQEQEDQAFWNDQMALREHVGRNVNPKKMQPSEEVAAASAKKEMLRYLAVKDRENIDRRQWKIEQAIKKYGVVKVREMMRRAKTE